MFEFNGEFFNTIDEVIAYMKTLYPADAWKAQTQSIMLWGHTTDDSYRVLENGQRMFGQIGTFMYKNGYMDENYQLTEQYDLAIKAKQNFPEFRELSLPRTYSESTLGGETFSNVNIPLGDPTVQGGSAGSVPTLNSKMTSDTGAVKTLTKVIDVEKVEDPQVPGTFSYLATLKMLGWLPLPTWTAMAAPLLGVSLGYGMYETNPDFWDRLAQKLAPYSYYGDLSGESIIRDIMRFPIMVGMNNSTYLMMTALDALREFFVEEGVYGGNEYSVDTLPQGITLPTGVNLPIAMGKGGVFHKTTPGTYSKTTISVDDDVYWALYSMSGDGVVVLSSLNPNAKYFAASSTSYPDPGPHTNSLSHSAVYNNQTVYYSYTSSGQFIETDVPVNETQYTGPVMDVADILAWVQAYASTPGGVEGMTPQPGATYPTDLTKTLPQIYPDWANGARNTLSDPYSDNYEDGTTGWLPASLSNTNYSNDTDLTSSTNDQPDAQSGDNTLNTQLQQILEALQDLPDTLTRDGLIPDNVPTNPPTSEDSPDPVPPVITGAGTDLIAIYNPSKQEIKDFNAFLWSLDPTNLANWGKVIQNPIDAIVSLHMIYVTPSTGASQHIKCGYIESDVSSAIVTNQYVDINCGAIALPEYFRNVWDYTATEIQIYLPFIGIVPLHTSDIMNSSIRVRYRVDVLTGACLAQIIVTKEGTTAVLYTFPGNCAVPLPLTGGSFTGVFSTLFTTIGATMVAGPAYGAGRAVGQVLRGEVKANISRSGHLGSNVGALGARIPYLIITRNKSLDAFMYNTQYGYPANATVTLGDMRGYTKVKSIHLSGIPCTDDELESIEALLKDGVIIN